MYIDYNVYRQEIINFLQTVAIKFDLFKEDYNYRIIVQQENMRKNRDHGYNLIKVDNLDKLYELTTKEVTFNSLVQDVSTNSIYRVVDTRYLSSEAGYKLYLEENYSSLENQDNPYYLNLCGNYSTLDNPIYITTVETNERVILSKENLENYPKTASIYRIPNLEYNNLLLSNPTQQGLIKSIIYPAKSIDDVIDARDITMLAYDKTLLETDEQDSLITALTIFLDYIYDRWLVKDFKYESAYGITFMGMLWSLLPSVLLTQRIKNLRTPQVHSMHVWEYLDSKGLGEYKSVLTRQQSLFLYRNIDYIIQNKGKKSNIEILANNLLKGLHLTLVGKNILQETESASHNNDCVHHPEFLSEDIIETSTAEQIDESTKESMNEMLYRMYSEGHYPDYSLDDSIVMDERFGLTEFNNLPTRLLEFEKALLNNKYICYLTEFLMDSLMYQYSRGSLTYRIKFTDVNVRKELDLSIGDVIALLYYAHHKASDTVAYSLPVRYTTRICYPGVKPDNLPTTWKYEGFTYLVDSFIDTKSILSDIVFDPGRFTTQESFMLRMANQFGALLKHTRQVRENAGTKYQQCMLYYYNYLVVHRTIDISLSRYKDYPSWIANTEGIAEFLEAYDELNDSKIYYQDLCDNLWNLLFPVESYEEFDDFTGGDRDNTYIYNAIKRLFAQLCSYRLFFLETDRRRSTFLVAPFAALCTHTGTDTSDSSVDISTGVKTTFKEDDKFETDFPIHLKDKSYKENAELLNVVDVKADLSKYVDRNHIYDKRDTRLSFTTKADAVNTITVGPNLILQPLP